MSALHLLPLFRRVAAAPVDRERALAVEAEELFVFGGCRDHTFDISITS